jgi:hypothetical protein
VVVVAPSAPGCGSHLVGEVLGQPAANLVAEGFDAGGEVQVHGLTGGGGTVASAPARFVPSLSI